MEPKTNLDEESLNEFFPRTCIFCYQTIDKHKFIYNSEKGAFEISCPIEEV